MLGEIIRLRAHRTVSFTAAVVSAGIVIGAVDIARPVTDRAQGELVPTTSISQYRGGWSAHHLQSKLSLLFAPQNSQSPH